MSLLTIPTRSMTKWSGIVDLVALLTTFLSTNHDVIHGLFSVNKSLRKINATTPRVIELLDSKGMDGAAKPDSAELIQYIYTKGMTLDLVSDIIYKTDNDMLQSYIQIGSHYKTSRDSLVESLCQDVGKYQLFPQNLKCGIITSYRMIEDIGEELCGNSHKCDVAIIARHNHVGNFHQYTFYTRNPEINTVALAHSLGYKDAGGRGKVCGFQTNENPETFVERHLLRRV